VRHWPNVAICSIVLICGINSLCQQNPSPPHRVNNQEPTKSVQDGGTETQQPLPTPQSQSKEKAQTTNQEHGPTTEKAEGWRDAFVPSTWVNWVLAFVGFIGAGIAIGTLYVLIKQTKATKLAADAAKKSADVADTALKLLERADILLNASSIDSQQMSGTDTRVVLQFKNFGRSRARNVRLKLNLIIKGVSTTDNSNIVPITMGASETQNIASDRFGDFLNGPLTREVLSGQRPLQFEGEASYIDVFDAPHRSYYAGTYDWRVGRFNIDRQETD
jgi:hypothetical protein